MATRLTPSTLLNMRGNTPLFIALAYENKIDTLETVRRWMRQNKPNGPLTSMGNLFLISSVLNVPIEYLTESKENETIREGVPDSSPVSSG